MKKVLKAESLYACGPAYVSGLALANVMSQRVSSEDLSLLCPPYNIIMMGEGRKLVKIADHFETAPRMLYKKCILPFTCPSSWRLNNTYPGLHHLGH